MITFISFIHQLVEYLGAVSTFLAITEYSLL